MNRFINEHIDIFDLPPITTQVTTAAVRNKSSAIYEYFVVIYVTGTQ